jgi:hypothetical protein
MPVTATASCAPVRLSAPAAIARTVASLTAPSLRSTECGTPSLKVLDSLL